ncbi:hypothetical protein LZ31DRAFT_329000 [Colletotrichum somersetense]|nr:hypothetical protein LZ31DRAFT_329000 [Colletotrichum somersetense]
MCAYLGSVRAYVRCTHPPCSHTPLSHFTLRPPTYCTAYTYHNTSLLNCTCLLWFSFLSLPPLLPGSCVFRLPTYLPTYLPGKLLSTLPQVPTPARQPIHPPATSSPPASTSHIRLPPPRLNFLLQPVHSRYPRPAFRFLECCTKLIELLCTFLVFSLYSPSYT